MIGFELKSKLFWRKATTLMAPAALQQLINIGINFLDNLMIGGFGETQIAAAAFGNQFYSLFQFICMGLGSGAVVLSSQFWGQKNLPSLRTAASIALRLTAGLCAVFTLLAVAWPQAILRVFTNEAAVVAVGTPYMRLIGCTFLLAGLTSTTTYLLRSVGKVNIPFIGSSIAFLLNLFFNWIFIFGKLGAPAMELVGAAVGTIIARAFEFCFIFGYFIFKDQRIKFRIRHFFLSGSGMWRQYFKFGLPVLVSDALLGISLALSGAITGHISESLAAAYSIVNSVVQMICVLNVGMAGASAVIIGNTIGEKDIPRAKREANTFVLISILFGLVIIIPLLLLEGPYFSMYDIEEQTRAMAHQMLLYGNCLWLPIQTLAYTLSKGILRGGGDTRFLLLADSSSVWLISLPLGALAGLVWHWPPVVIYVLLRVEYPLKGLVCLFRYLSGKWIKEIPAQAKN